MLSAALDMIPNFSSLSARNLTSTCCYFSRDNISVRHFPLIFPLSFASACSTFFRSLPTSLSPISPFLFTHTPHLYFVSGISSDHMTYAYKQIESSHSFLSLVSLDLSTNSISSFPSILHSLSNLKKLILASNALGSSSSFDLGTDCTQIVRIMLCHTVCSLVCLQN